MKGWWIKLTGLIALIAGYFAVKSKLQAHEIENLKEEGAHNEKLQAIEKTVEEVEIRAEAKEDEAIKNFDDTDWGNGI